MAETATTDEKNQPMGMIVGGAPMEGVFNFRDLGGPVGSAGTLLRPGLVFRADGIHRSDSEGKARLVLTTDLRQVIDLRSAKELEVDGRFEHPGVVHHHLPIVEDISEFAADTDTDTEDLLHHHYVRLANKNGSTFAAGLELVAEAVDGGQPVLYHCTAGKDRTGVLTALLLAGLGIDDDTIAEDYARSAHGMRELMAWYSRSGKATPDQQMKKMGLDPAKAEQMIGARKQTMLGVLADLRSQHQTIEGFLASIQATDSVATIGRHLLAD